MSPPEVPSVKEYWDIVGQMGCWVCGAAPQLHHVGGGSVKEMGIHKAKGSKNNDYLVMPLCIIHHTTGKDAIHQAGVVSWEKKFGRQVDAINAIIESTGINVWEIAGKELEEERASRKYNAPKKKQSKGNTSRPSKILPRRI